MGSYGSLLQMVSINSMKTPINLLTIVIKYKKVVSL